MKKYTEEEIEKLRASVAKSLHRKRKQIAKKAAKVKKKNQAAKIKAGKTLNNEAIKQAPLQENDVDDKTSCVASTGKMQLNMDIIKKQQSINNKGIAVYTNENRAGVLLNNNSVTDNAIKYVDLLDIGIMKERLKVDSLDQPPHLSISKLFPELTFIQGDSDVYAQRDAFLKKVISGHPLRREILLIEYILRNPHEALYCNELGVNAIYDNIALFLPISMLIKLELILSYIYYTGENIDPRDIFLKLGKLINKTGYSSEQKMRSLIYRAIMRVHGKYSADTLSKIFVFGGNIEITDNFKVHTLFVHFMHLIEVIIMYTPKGYLLIAELCEKFFKNVYITPDILFAIKHDRSKHKFVQLKEYIQKPDRICVGSWYSFLEKILLVLSKGNSINSHCYGIYSKLIRSRPTQGSLLLTLLNDIRLEIAGLNRVVNKRRAENDKLVIAQGINRKKILKEARENIINGIFADNMISLTDKAKRKEMQALKRVAKSKVAESRRNNLKYYRGGI